MLAVSVAALLPLSALSASAQGLDKDAGTVALPHIIVTGEKVERTLKETASSVTVISEDDIADAPSAMTVPDLLKNTPNVFYTSNTDAPIVRGVDAKGPINFGGAYLAKPIPRVTINVDGRYLNAAELDFGAAGTWDVDSVEVYRGPQTTSQGANSIAGAIIVNTKDPSFATEYAAQALYGSRNKKRASLMASGALSNDFAARVAIDYSGRDTFIDYTNPDFSARDFDFDWQNLNTRMKLLWQPEDIPGLEAKLTYSHTDVNRPRYEAASEPYDDLNNAEGYQDNQTSRNNVGIFDVTYDFADDVTVTNKIQYSVGVYDYRFSAPFAGSANRDNSTVANETRVNFGTESSSLSGVAGLYYSYDLTNNRLDNALGSADADLTHHSASPFGELTWRFADRWALTGGLRYQYDWIGHEGVNSYVSGAYHDYGKAFSAVLPRISLAYDLSSNVTVGALISRGYVPGGTGVNIRGGEYYTFEEETAWNYELFTRAGFLGNRLFLTGNLFYTEYENAQRSVTDYLDGIPFGSVIINADKAETYGLELGASYNVTDAINIHGGAGLLQTEISQFSDYRGSEFVGNEFAKAPGYMFNVGADWDVTSEVRLSASVRHTDSYFSNDTNDASLRVEAYTIADARVTYMPTENVELLAYANNIFDNRVATQKYTDRTSGGVSAYMAEPREVGLALKLRF
ncbi:TonB-dependent receptor [Nisaea sp.]|uniref:TonB-dependent receptor n=2 Tax=Alphaproteobacteria TaxID=28211 RepID=UPI0032631D23